jgi:hypothetical protein
VVILKSRAAQGAARVLGRSRADCATEAARPLAASACPREVRVTKVHSTRATVAMSDVMQNQGPAAFGPCRSLVAPLHERPRLHGALV